MMLLESCVLPLSHLTNVLPTKFVLFFKDISDEENCRPPLAVIAAPLSVLTELISIVVTPPLVD